MTHMFAIKAAKTMRNAVYRKLQRKKENNDWVLLPFSGPRSSNEGFRSCTYPGSVCLHVATGLRCSPWTYFLPEVCTHFPAYGFAD
jgi:hypothetical protein